MSWSLANQKMVFFNTTFPLRLPNSRVIFTGSWVFWKQISFAHPRLSGHLPYNLPVLSNAVFPCKEVFPLSNERCAKGKTLNGCCSFVHLLLSIMSLHKLRTIGCKSMSSCSSVNPTRKGRCAAEFETKRV